ncbi:MAG: S-layer homology domain-containing protein [Candidatus Peribacteraceae bacterium]|nr:S-layer homology domain-containing protein [Candidatus Peribacteraceae bacterium]
MIVLAPKSLAELNPSTIYVQQTSPTGTIGEWSLIKPDKNKLSRSKDQFTLEEAELGQYTLIVSPPEGAITNIHKFIDNDFIETANLPQMSFELDEGMEVTLRIEFTFTKIGMVSVNSDPSGLEFTMIGPNDTNIRGVTPKSYPDFPIGQYTVTYDELPDCASPKPVSDKLIKEGRINFNIKIACEGIEDLIQQQEKYKSFEYVDVVINGKSIIFNDVPSKEWYAPFVHNALKTGIMSGYKDERGNISGEFGPDRNMTMAELLKIAHSIANIDETKVFNKPKNVYASDTWFETYMASAEKLNWLAYRNNRKNPSDEATRAEVVVTLLQALEIPRYWATGMLFTDVRRNTPYASSIETAAMDGLISGYENGSFRPNNPMNRAEVAKVLSQAIDLYVNGE